MTKRSYLFALMLTLVYLSVATAQQYPIMDKLADKLVQKYQSSSCQQLSEKRAEKKPPTPQEQKAMQMLHNDPQMRAAFINKVAAPIANKMFECGMIP